MPLFRRKPKPEPKPERLDARAVQKLALTLEKARLGDYVEMMNDPWKNLYLNFVAGIARGAGIAVGTVLVGGLIILIAVHGLKVAFRHAGGVPWVGEQVKEAVGFVLQAAHEKAGSDDGE
jgi:hypothetical protein